MSKEDLTTIVSRALTDKEYRSKLLTDIDAALEGYQLDDDEMKMVRNLPAEAFDELTMHLENRLSKSGFMGGLSSLMGGKDAVDASTVVDLLRNKYGGA